VQTQRKEQEREEKKNKKNLIYENEWKKAKTPRSELESTWKKRKENKRRELNSLTFQTHLSFTLYTHTQQKNTLNHVPIYASYWQSAFFFSFSFRFVSWHWLERDARFCSWKKWVIAACVGDDCIKIDRFKKKRNLNPHSTTLHLSKTRSKPIETHSSMCFSHVSRRFTRNMISRDAIRARKRRIVRKRRFFVFRECNPRQHLEARLDTFWVKKKKKRTDPFTSSFSHTKNIIYDS